MLLGSPAFVAAARPWVRRLGGNLYTHAPAAISAWAGFRESKDAFRARRDRLRDLVAILTAELCGGEAPLLRFDPPVPETSLVHVYLSSDARTAVAAAAAAEAATGVRVLSRARPAQFGAVGQCLFELNLGPANGGIGSAVWLRGWREMITRLRGMLDVLASTSSSAYAVV